MGGPHRMLHWLRGVPDCGPCVAAGSQGQAVTNSGQHILNRPARRRVIENLRGCDERKRSARCAYSIFLAGA
jgi:hypothetical protein